jgi:hypothetical protein
MFYIISRASKYFVVFGGTKKKGEFESALKRCANIL